MHNKRRGFTIVELLIVIVVIGILAATTVVAFNGMQNRARSSASMSVLSQAEKLIRAYGVTTGSLPGSMCVGQASEYTANPPFAANHCTTETSETDFTSSTSTYGPFYDAAINQAVSTHNINTGVPVVVNVALGSGYALVTRGVYWSRSTNNSGWLGYTLKGKVPCTVTATSTYYSDSDVTNCRVNITI